jgi:leucyl aminopeptidase
MDADVLRRAAAAAVRRLADGQWTSLSFPVPSGAADFAVQSLVEGAGLAAYRFEKHKSRPAPAHPLTTFAVVSSSANAAERAALERAAVIVEAVAVARDLINEPPSEKPAPWLAKAARLLAVRGLTVRVYDKTALKKMGLGALLGVNRGSAHPPALVELHYRPTGRVKRRVALVGKGITFDSGGLSLKPADGMMTMKYDMAGAATVLAVTRAAARLRLPVEIRTFAAITENMPGPDAYKPGDVLRAMNGKTIEVLNTDAEGRLVLADALALAARRPVDQIIDVATLTGAVTVALGRAFAGIMSNTPALEAELRAAGERSAERVWPLPLEKTYKEHIKSKVADLKNIGTPGEAGTIIGGLFLEEFVDGKPWAHLDIAGVGWNGNGTALAPAGATGVPVRMLIDFLRAI